MVMKYDVRIETPPRELIALRAVEEPRLMQESRDVTTKETTTDRTGIFQPCGTWTRVSLFLCGSAEEVL